VTRRPHVIAIALLAGAGALTAAACNGTAVFDAPDPDACASGHGCPMVACACADGSAMLDTTCSRGHCGSPDEICLDRCEPFGGLIGTLATADDEVAVPGCDTFCTRLDIHGCELGCDTLFSACRAPSSCSEGAGAFWQCVVNDAVLTCIDNAVRVERCEVSQLGICDK
jgi:hypothetical protein